MQKFLELHLLQLLLCH